MTKDEVLDQYFVRQAMDVWAKQQGIAFATFRDEFKREESRRVREEEKRLGGMITWIPQSDEDIYNQFIEQQNKLK